LQRSQERFSSNIDVKIRNVLLQSNNIDAELREQLRDDWVVQDVADKIFDGALKKLPLKDDHIAQQGWILSSGVLNRVDHWENNAKQRSSESFSIWKCEANRLSNRYIAGRKQTCQEARCCC